jgi:hypothetical protein
MNVVRPAICTGQATPGRNWTQLFHGIAGWHNTLCGNLRLRLTPAEQLTENLTLQALQRMP